VHQTLTGEPGEDEKERQNERREGKAPARKVIVGNAAKNDGARSGKKRESWVFLFN